MATKTKKIPTRCNTPLDRGIYVHSSRIRRYLDTLGLNASIDDAISELKNAEPHQVKILNDKKEVTGTKITDLVKFSDLSQATQQLVIKAREHVTARAAEAAAHAAKKGVETEVKPKKIKNTPYSADVLALSKLRVRFSKDAAVYVSAALCESLHQLFDFGMMNALTSGNKILKVRHCLQSGQNDLTLSCLYRNLSVFKTAQEAEALRLSEEEQKLLAKKQKTRTTIDDIVHPTEHAVPTNPSPVVSDEEEEEDDDEFSHYVKQVCFDVINQKIASWKPLNTKDKHPYADIRLSKEVREFGSQLIVGFVERLLPLVKRQLDTLGVKTVGYETTKQLIQFQLDLFDVNTPEIQATLDKKVELWRAWSAKRKEEKLAHMAEKKKAAEAASTGVPPTPAKASTPAAVPPTPTTVPPTPANA